MTIPPALSDLQRMELQISTLFCCNSDGRLRCVNEIDEPPAPRLFMGRTRQGNLWRLRHDLPLETAQALDRLCGSEPVAADLSQPPRNYTAIQSILREHAPFAGEHRGPAYWIPDDSLPATDAVIISQTDRGFASDRDAERTANLREPFAWIVPLLGRPELGPVAAVIIEGRAISLCFCSRRPGQATEAGVETVADYRGQGYASAAVACWAAEVRRQGVIPLYSTAWENLASQAVARKLHMVQYGEDWSIL